MIAGDADELVVCEEVPVAEELDVREVSSPVERIDMIAVRLTAA